MPRGLAALVLLPDLADPMAGLKRPLGGLADLGKLRVKHLQVDPLRALQAGEDAGF